jgi:hypothetical protein
VRGISIQAASHGQTASEVPHITQRSRGSIGARWGVEPAPSVAARTVSRSMRRSSVPNRCGRTSYPVPRHGRSSSRPKSSRSK